MPHAMLSHLTLNTGHLAATPKHDVAPQVIRALRPLVESCNGPVPGLPGWHLAFLPALDADAAKTPGTFTGAGYFQIADEPGLSKRPVVGCVACWREDAATEAWRKVKHGYGTLRGPLQRLHFWREPPRPPALPWLAVYLTPFLTRAEPADLQAFGDLERCVAWTMAGAFP